MGVKGDWVYTYSPLATGGSLCILQTPTHYLKTRCQAGFEMEAMVRLLADARIS